MSIYKSKAIVGQGVLSESAVWCPEEGLAVDMEGSMALEWTCKTKASADRHYRYFQWYMLLAVSLFLIYMLWVVWDSLPGSLEFFLWFSGFVYTFSGLMILAFRQKTVFNYSLYRNAGKCESYLNFPSWSGGIFKGIAIIALMIFFGLAIVMGSFALLLRCSARAH